MLFLSLKQKAKTNFKFLKPAQAEMRAIFV